MAWLRLDTRLLSFAGTIACCFSVCCWDCSWHGLIWSKCPKEEENFQTPKGFDASGWLTRGCCECLQHCQRSMSTLPFVLSNFHKFLNGAVLSVVVDQKFIADSCNTVWLGQKWASSNLNETVGMRYHQLILEQEFTNLEHCSCCVHRQFGRSNISIQVQHLWLV